MTVALSFSARIHLLHQALAAAGISHAFGGAIALGWCTPQARGTNDIDSIDIAAVVTEIRDLLGDNDGGRIAKLEALRS